MAKISTTANKNLADVCFFGGRGRGIDEVHKGEGSKDVSKDLRIETHCG